MLNINKTIENGEAVFVLKGRLDTNTAPELDNALLSSLNGVKTLTLNTKELDYISSAGLRVLLSAKKIMNKQQGEMKVINVNATIREIFDVTGLLDILDVREAD
ncbi:MAG: STAS domain-containing protein [Clostridia bacterium]|nr:STAS domain-containing protein [Clostridia bacterium]